jgi:hypothetical protein
MAAWQAGRCAVNISRTSGYRYLFLLNAAALLAAGCSEPVDALSNTNTSALQADPYPAKWTDESGLYTPGFGQLSFMARDGNELPARTYRATGFDEHNGPIWFVIHGAKRTTERYIATVAPAAERHNALAIAITFSKQNYPSNRGFTLIVTTEGDPDDTALAEGRWRNPEDYLHSEIEHVFESVRISLGGSQPGYYLFGHSAGAQFTHRLMTFLPHARVRGAVAANAGWYTLPLSGSGKSYSMPYGLRGTPLNEADVSSLLAAPLTVLVGERDTKTPGEDPLVRGTMEAMMQGRNRRERGQYYYEMGRARAEDAPFGWRFATAPRAKHSSSQVIASAAFFLFNEEEVPCIPDSAADAAGLVITEILADPPPGASGDANRDGIRDSLADEFVEMVNTSSNPICLSGWSLGDARKPERHVFPLGRALSPGEALVVFGSGIPTGEFGGANVQWAAFDGRLNLSNDGDVLSLRDPTGDIAIQVSWGDCAGRTCAKDHIEKDLGINGSMIAIPDESGKWEPHADASDASFSPGLRTDGSNWQPAEDVMQ